MGYDDLFLQIEILVFSDGRKEVYSWKIVKTKIFSELTKKTAEGNVSKKKKMFMFPLLFSSFWILKKELCDTLDL